MWKEYEIPHERGVCATSYANAFMFFERPSGVIFFFLESMELRHQRFKGGWLGIYGRLYGMSKPKGNILA